MKEAEVHVGGTYLAKVTGKVVPVKLNAESRHGGWDATNMVTNKKIRVKTARRLQGPIKLHTPPADDVAPATPQAAAPKAASTEPTATKSTAPQKAKEPKAGKLSALDAAAKVMAEAGEPMTTKAMIEAMAAKGYWTSPGGKTPEATLYSAILREIATKGAKARFAKTERGKFALAAAK